MLSFLRMFYNQATQYCLYKSLKQSLTEHLLCTSSVPGVLGTFISLNSHGSPMQQVLLSQVQGQEMVAQSNLPRTTTRKWWSQDWNSTLILRLQVVTTKLYSLRNTHTKCILTNHICFLERSLTHALKPGKFYGGSQPSLNDRQADRKI